MIVSRLPRPARPHGCPGVFFRPSAVLTASALVRSCWRSIARRGAVREIVKATSLARNTVLKYLRIGKVVLRAALRIRGNPRSVATPCPRTSKTKLLVRQDVLPVSDQPLHRQVDERAGPCGLLVAAAKVDEVAGVAGAAVDEQRHEDLGADALTLSADDLRTIGEAPGSTDVQGARYPAALAALVGR